MVLCVYGTEREVLHYRMEYLLVSKGRHAFRVHYWGLYRISVATQEEVRTEGLAQQCYTVISFTERVLCIGKKIPFSSTSN